MSAQPHELFIDRPGPGGRHGFTVSREGLWDSEIRIDGLPADRHYPRPGEVQEASAGRPEGTRHWRTSAGVYTLTEEERSRALSLPLRLTGTTPPPRGQRLADEIVNTFVLAGPERTCRSGCPCLTALGAWKVVREAMASYGDTLRLQGISTGMFGSVSEDGRSGEWEFTIDLVHEVAQVRCGVHAVTARDVYGATAADHGAQPDDWRTYMTAHIRPWDYPAQRERWETRSGLPLEGWRDSAAACADFVAQGADWMSVSDRQDQISITVFSGRKSPVWETQIMEMPEDGEDGNEKLYTSPFLAR